ncbi:glycosyltransferase [Terasakiella pusilla]|uniref:glycosyltransferase n=1 Tax=Terasakiella pusilla TaxID=64973 RepID=UPI003AA9E1A8
MTPDHHIRENLKQARTAFKAENLEEAEKQARFIIDLDPHHENALKLLARIYNRQARWSQAFTCWHALCKIKADNEEYFFQAGRSATRLDNHSQAVKFLKKTIELKGDHESALTLLAKTYQKQGQWHLAFETWKALGEATNDLSSQLDNLIKTASRQQESPFQANAFEVILTLEPNNRKILQKLASLYQKQENQIEAARILDQLLKNDEQNLDLLQQRLKIATKLENHDDIYRFRKCLCALTPFDEEEWVKLAQNAKNINSADQHAIWQKILTHRKENEQALRGLARLKTLHEDWDSAIQLWAEVAKKTPEDPWPLVQKARAVAKIKSTEDARQNWLTLLEKHPDHVEALTCLGRIEMVEKNWETASGYWQQLKQVAPHLTEPAIQLSRIHLAHKDDAQAESALSDILTLQPDHPEALSNLSRLYFRTDREEQGFAICEEWAKSNPDDLRPLLILARAHHANGDLSPAKREAGWQRVLARDPNHLEALTGLARLLQARQDYSTALSLWEKLCDLDETKAIAWTNRVRILDKTDQPELIPPLLEQVRTLFGTSVEDLLSKAEVFEAARSFEDARLYLQEACASYPDNVLPHKRYGNFLLSQGELTTSLNAYRTARELAPYDTQIASALVQIVSSFELVGQDITPYWQTGSTQPLLQTPEIFYPKIAEIAQARRPKTSKKSQKHTVVMVTGSLGPGGAERQLVATAIALKEQTDQVAHVTVLVRSLNDHDRSAFFLPHLEEAGIPVHEYGPSRADTEECAYVKDCPEVELLRTFPPNMNKSLVKLYRLFKELAPTIVHAWQDTTAVDAATSAVLAGVEKVLLSTRSLRPDHHRRLLPYLKPAYQALLQLDGVRMTNNSRAGLLDYADWLSLPLEEGDVTPNGLDTARLQKERQAANSQKIMQQLNIPADAPVFGGVMRFTEEKRPLLWVQTMAKVAEKIPNAHFVLVGDGPMRPQAQALCHTLGLAERAHLVGTDRDVVPWYSLMDMLLLTSRVEGCPNVLLEAQCLGIPVVAPKVGGAPETVDDTQTGWIVPADHPDLSSALAERLIYSQQNQPWYLNAQKRAPLFIENTFGLKASLASTLRAFEF